MPPSSNTDAVSQAANLLRARIRELDSERSQLERALASLTDGRPGRRRPGRPPGSTGRTTTRRRRRRRNTRSDQAVKLVAANPGISALHGGHQVAQKSSRITFPLNDESFTDAPFMSVTVKSRLAFFALAGQVAAPPSATTAAGDGSDGMKA